MNISYFCNGDVGNSKNLSISVKKTLKTFIEIKIKSSLICIRICQLLWREQIQKGLVQLSLSVATRTPESKFSVRS